MFVLVWTLTVQCHVVMMPVVLGWTLTVHGHAVMMLVLFAGDHNGNAGDYGTTHHSGGQLFYSFFTWEIYRLFKLTDFSTNWGIRSGI